MAKKTETVGSEIAEGLKELELAGQIAQLLRPVPHDHRGGVLDLVDAMLDFFDARVRSSAAAAKPR